MSPRSIFDDHADLKAAGSHLLHSSEIKILRDELARAIAHGKKTEKELGSTIENMVIENAGLRAENADLRAEIAVLKRENSP